MLLVCLTRFLTLSYDLTVHLRSIQLHYDVHALRHVRADQSRPYELRAVPFSCRLWHTNGADRVL